MSYPPWLKSIARSSFVHTLGNIVQDLVLACVILLSVEAVHGMLLRMDYREIFRVLFMDIHEGTALGIIAVLSIRSMLRLATRKLEP